MKSTTIADAQARKVPECTTFREWLSWPLRKLVFDRTLAAWRSRPHTHACPACGHTSADLAHCCGTLSSDDRDMGDHKWYSTGAAGHKPSRVWLSERMVPIDSPAARAAIAKRAYRERQRSAVTS